MILRIIGAMVTLATATAGVIAVTHGEDSRLPIDTEVAATVEDSIGVGHEIASNRGQEIAGQKRNAKSVEAPRGPKDKERDPTTTTVLTTSSTEATTTSSQASSSSTTKATTTSTSATTTSSTQPVSGNIVAPGQSIQQAIDRLPNGAQITLLTGIHRLQTFVPKPGQVITGQTGAVVSGAALLEAWSPNGPYWTTSGLGISADKFTDYTGQACLDETSAGLGSGPGACRYPHRVFIDDRPLTQVMDKSRLGSGKFYFDYANDLIWIAESPSGKKIEIAALPYAINARHVNGITIRGLIFEKYGTPFAQAAVMGGANWVIENSEFRANQANAVKVDDRSIVRGCQMHSQSQGALRVVNGAVGVQFLDNEIYGNGYGGVNPTYTGGGSKFVESVDLVVRGNHVHDNFGPGLWSDGGNVGILYENNVVENNAGAGIMHELSHDATIRNNRVVGNGYKFNLGGIYVANSNNVEVYGNTLENNKVGILARQQDRGVDVENLSVHDNTIIKTSGDGFAAGLIEAVGDASFFTTRNNRFWGNIYQIADQYGRPYHWAGSSRTKTEWQKYGNDTDGTWR